MCSKCGRVIVGQADWIRLPESVGGRMTIRISPVHHNCALAAVAAAGKEYDRQYHPQAYQR